MPSFLGAASAAQIVVLALEEDPRLLSDKNRQGRVNHSGRIACHLTSGAHHGPGLEDHQGAGPSGTPGPGTAPSIAPPRIYLGRIQDITRTLSIRTGSPTGMVGPVSLVRAIRAQMERASPAFRACSIPYFSHRTAWRPIPFNKKTCDATGFVCRSWTRGSSDGSFANRRRIRASSGLEVWPKGRKSLQNVALPDTNVRPKLPRKGVSGRVSRACWSYRRDDSNRVMP